MWSFAWRNLLARGSRTALTAVGVSIPVLGFLGLITLSNGVRSLFGDSLEQIPGLIVVRENTPSPVFSDLPARLAETIRRMPGVRVVAPQLWKIAPSIEGKSLFGRAMTGLLANPAKQTGRGFLDASIIYGLDLEEHSKLRYELFKSKMVPKASRGGRYLSTVDRGTNHIVISRKLSRDFRDRDGRPKEVGDDLRIGNQSFEIIGIYETGSILFDVMILMDIGVARKLVGADDNSVSAFYVEPQDYTDLAKVRDRINVLVPEVDARVSDEFRQDTARFLDNMDVVLDAIMAVSLMVGIVGIVNTMAMSVLERQAEFGILRTNGWNKRHVLMLVLQESILIGFIGGVSGGAAAIVSAGIVNCFLTGGFKLVVTVWLLVLGLAIAIAVGTLSGLYPAWRASRLAPMEAIRRGSR